MNDGRAAGRRFVGALPALIALAVPGSGSASAADWMATPDPQVSRAQLWPTDGAMVEQSPPDFHWPALAGAAGYRVTLRSSDGSARSLQTTRNWINWDEVLPAGDYAWQVTATGSDTASSERRFRVSPDAVPFVVPPAGVLLERALAARHPRTLPGPAVLGAMLAERGRALDGLLARVASSDRPAVPRAPDALPAAQRDARINAAVRATHESLFACVAGGEARYCDIARRRVAALAGWDPDGFTAYDRNDQLARGVAAVLAQAYDWLFDRLADDERRRLLAVLEARLAAIHRDLFPGDERLSRFPYDSHRNHTLTVFAAIAVMLAGELEAADDWLRRALPMALHWTSPWGGEDGGFANGTAYALWVNNDLLLAWYALETAIGVDLSRKAWVRNQATFLAYFLPPGTPAGLFGDGAERRLAEITARYGQAHALFANSPLGDWYAASVAGADPSRLQLLLAPPARDTGGALPAGQANAAMLPSSGWVALHSDLGDPRRTSIYFKSGADYGPYTHLHADQLSLVLRHRGRRLLIDSGHYDDYGTRRWRSWYTQTRAHNAVTYDGGRGQLTHHDDGRAFGGHIARFEHGDDYDIVSGDASRAYGSEIRHASRDLVYLRPDRLIVRDRMRAGTPRRWEWNLHALREFGVDDAGRRLELRRDDAAVCIDLLSAPAISAAQERSATRGADGDPAAQWHLALAVDEPATEIDMLTLFRIDCREADPDVRISSGATEVTFADYVLRFGDRIGVTPRKAASGGAGAGGAAAQPGGERAVPHDP